MSIDSHSLTTAETVKSPKPKKCFIQRLCFCKKNRVNVEISDDSISPPPIQIPCNDVSINEEKETPRTDKRNVNGPLSLVSPGCIPNSNRRTMSYNLSNNLSRIDEMPEEHLEHKSKKLSYPKSHLPGNKLTIAGYMQQTKKPIKGYGTSASNFNFYLRNNKKYASQKKTDSTNTTTAALTGDTSTASDINN